MRWKMLDMRKAMQTWCHAIQLRRRLVHLSRAQKMRKMGHCVLLWAAQLTASQRLHRAETERDVLTMQWTQSLCMHFVNTRSRRRLQASLRLWSQTSACWQRRKAVGTWLRFRWIRFTVKRMLVQWSSSVGRYQFLRETGLRIVIAGWHRTQERTLRRWVLCSLVRYNKEQQDQILSNRLGRDVINTRSGDRSLSLRGANLDCESFWRGNELAAFYIRAACVAHRVRLRRVLHTMRLRLEDKAARHVMQGRLSQRLQRLEDKWASEWIKKGFHAWHQLCRHRAASVVAANSMCRCLVNRKTRSTFRNNLSGWQEHAARRSRLARAETLVMVRCRLRVLVRVLRAWRPQQPPFDCSADAAAEGAPRSEASRNAKMAELQNRAASLRDVIALQPGLHDVQAMERSGVVASPNRDGCAR